MLYNNKNFKKLSLLLLPILLSIIQTFFMIDAKIQDKRNLEAKLISNTLMINPEIQNKEENLKLLINNEEVDNLSIMQLQIINSGKQPLMTKDFEEPIRIELDNIKKILSAKVITSHPSNIDFNLVIKSNYIEIEKGLINEGDNFTIEIRSIPKLNLKPDIQNISARIARIEKINYTKSLTEDSSELVSSINKNLNIAITTNMIIIISFLLAFFKYERSFKETKTLMDKKLYELQCISQDESRKIFRDLIIKNYKDDYQELIDKIDKLPQLPSNKIELDELAVYIKENE
ncbi:hypothetical protein [Tepidibacter hydrothermalis]|uniref:Uncharacterized protein n=1 Tax=Tepidibacter hydrothermalis TaxID=3036126 RepID=A0ABY8E7C5_9FIRM|nr:hypothetical protein [Tepidibacter hydrothermalis]WFD08754.1 hypothetical protein P4S50_10125 [Tepidibacter hydrothermalis]